ncbi:hypothetical protein RFI_15813 [Reticulomyxa filosa]|uniref:peptide-methionine (S)-S-oxide reductase n=1 Tax=Reticulomyxa filosa TaxID=46433 RepID=X6N562_RETFI|nr:hypothetical protein RFI_15813 [Reticulomyxa filosa]|eukprot:ETO21395.1 hypothetical protein RFI_15813 [Reticulomyxa filosa]
MRQGNDVGTQYRSCIYYSNEEQMALAFQSKDEYEKEIKKKENHYVPITTEIKNMNDLEFYYAENYHQQYLSKDPDGYCGLKGLGVMCPLPIKESKNVETENKNDL